MGSPGYAAVQPLLRSISALPRGVNRVLETIDHGQYLEPIWQMLGIDLKPQPPTAGMLPQMQPQPEQPMPQKPMRMKR